MAAFRSLCLLVLSAAAVVCHDRPIIGILAQDSTSGYGDTIIPTSYVKFLMMGGARVVAIRAQEPDSYYQTMFDKINGLLIPGGSVSVSTSQFARSANLMLALAEQANKDGDYFPVMGICLGFQILTNYFAGRNRLSSTPGTGDISLPLTFTTGASTSRILQNASPDILTSLQTEAITYNTHNYGIHLWKFEIQAELKDFFTVVSTNLDSNNEAFASTVEAKNASMPFYGTQWHPEKNSFDWNPTRDIDHGLNGIRATQHFANFFVEETRKSNHAFASASEEGQALIQTEYRRYFTGGKFFENFYIDYAT